MLLSGADIECISIHQHRGGRGGGGGRGGCGGRGSRGIVVSSLARHSLRAHLVHRGNNNQTGVSLDADGDSLRCRLRSCYLYSSAQNCTVFLSRVHPLSFFHF